MPTLTTSINTCATPAATYYAIPTWTARPSLCAPSSYLKTVQITAWQPTGIQTACDAACNSHSPSCKAYVATEVYVSSASTYDINCFLYTALPPSPTAAATCTGSAAPVSVLAKYRDDVRSCFAASATAAANYCNLVLGLPAASTVTQFSATTTPVATATVTSFATKSVCVVGGAGRVAAAEEGDVSDAIPTSEPILPRLPPDNTNSNQNHPRNTPGFEPACLAATSLYPSWDVGAACSCLATTSSQSVTTVKNRISTAPATTTTVIATVTTRVLKSAIPTFQPKVNVPGKKGGGTFSLISRVVKDASQADRRILMFSKGKGKTTEDGGGEDGGGGGGANDGHDNQVDMHIGLEDQGMYLVTQDKNKLKSYGQISFVTLDGGVKVIGQIPSSGGKSGGGDVAFASCFAPVAGPMECKLKSGEKAVFTQVEIPGLKKRFAIGVTSGKPGKDDKVVSLIVTEWGTVIAGCGGKS